MAWNSKTSLASRTLLSSRIELLQTALTDRLDDRMVYMEGIDASYQYEGYSKYRADELPPEIL